MLSPIARVLGLGRHLLQLTSGGFWWRAWRLVWKCEPANRAGSDAILVLSSERSARGTTYDQWVAPLAKVGQSADIESLIQSLGPRPNFFPIPAYRDWLESRPACNATWTHLCVGFTSGELQPREAVLVRGSNRK